MHLLYEVEQTGKLFSACLTTIDSKIDTTAKATVEAAETMLKRQGVGRDEWEEKGAMRE